MTIEQRKEWDILISRIREGYPNLSLHGKGRREALLAVDVALRQDALPLAVPLGESYKMGYDCGKNGSNEINCHYTLFATPGSTAEWERGKADAEAGKNA